jgi:PIN domain nuclease of toxin-antitoxin system
LKFLLDTHVLLWWLFDSPKLSANLRSIVAERSHVILVSSASAWEIATKFRIGKLPEASSF